MLTMYDDTNVGALPVGGNAYAGYVDGDYENYAAVVARFPSAIHLSITTRHLYTASADCLDIEAGDALSTDAPGFVKARSGLRVLYTSQGNVSTLMWALGTTPRNDYKLWTAHYGYGLHICGPSTCGIAWQADGTQWYSGPYDQSLLAPDFFEPTPVPPPPLGDSPMYVRNDGAAFTVGTVTVANGAIALCDSQGAALFSGNHWSSVVNGYAAVKAPLPIVNDAVLLAQFCALGFKVLGG